MHRIAVFVVALAVLAFAGWSRSQDAPRPSQNDADAQVSAARLRTIRGILYFHTTVETDMEHLADVVHEKLRTAEQAAGKAGADIVGTPVLIYRGATGDLKKRFSLDIGFPVKNEVTADGHRVKRLADFRCLSLLYSGSASAVPQAYEALTAAATQRKVKLTDESRQMLLYWEGADSPNNIMQVMIGVE